MAYGYANNNDLSVFDRIADHVREEAAKLGVWGVFAMADIHQKIIRFAHINTEHSIDEDAEGVYNILVISLIEVGMVVTYRTHTGYYSTKIIGEFPRKGGRLSENGAFAYAFSGGAQDADDLLMREAEQFHKAL